MSTLCVPLDRVVGAETNPVRQRTILSLFLGQSALRAKSLLGGLQKKSDDKLATIVKMARFMQLDVVSPAILDSP